MNLWNFICAIIILLIVSLFETHDFDPYKSIETASNLKIWEVILFSLSWTLSFNGTEQTLIYAEGL